ncbi:MAG: hypothetical protein MUC53_00560 [Candidatus Contendobacter sp.]|jgi:hypothetical protein|nr:hypothetical protein [Candidatus Contendobacter sp.]
MKWSVLPLLLFLVACRTLDSADGTGADRIPVGTLAVLHQDLVIPPNQAGVFIQGTPIGDRYRYDAACRLEVLTVDATFRTVVADRFTVVRVVQDWERFSQRESGLRRVSLDYDGPALLRFSTTFYLQSDRQPDVFRLVCSHLQDSGQNPRFLTAAEIRTTLAPVMTLQDAPPR